MEKYLLINSVLTNIFDCQNTLPNVEVDELFRDQLLYCEFRRPFMAELLASFSDGEISWIDAMDRYLGINRSNFADETEARAFAKEVFYDPAMAIELERSASYGG